MPRKKPNSSVVATTLAHVEGIHPITHTWYRLRYLSDDTVTIERVAYTSLIRDPLTGKLEGQLVAYEPLTQDPKHTAHLWEIIQHNPTNPRHKQHGQPNRKNDRSGVSDDDSPEETSPESETEVE